MRSSLKLFTVSGIDIRLHITFPLIFVWAALQFGLLSGDVGSAIFGIVAVSILFVLVTLHELGHSLAAQYYGIPVKQIVLSPIGGVAQLDRIPEKPLQEFIIALAGPAVNLLIALAMAAVLGTTPIELVNPFAALLGFSVFNISQLFSYIFLYNILLAFFNLLPAFPLDGGRIFRALLAMRLEYVKATQIAALVGRVVAAVMGLFGILNGNFFLIFIAIFIFVGAGQEAKFVQLRNALRGYQVKDAYSRSVYWLRPDNTVQQVRNLMIYGRQRDFPVLVEDQLVGFLGHGEIMRALPVTVPHTRVSAIMNRHIIPASIDDDLYLVQQRFLESGTTALPVVDRGRFMGMITLDHIQLLRRQVLQTPNVIVQNQSV